MRAKVKRDILDALHGLALSNWREFGASPALCQQYLRDLRAKRFVYTSDPETCGEPDCWSTYRDLAERYRGKPILLDCEDAAAAHAAWLASQCYSGIYVGFVPAPGISHAIVGVKVSGSMRVVDPCRWYGMGPTPYEGAVYKKVSDR